MRNERPAGVTLLEMLVALLVLGVLASLALPGYRHYLLRAGRIEGRAALLNLAAAQERFHLQCHTYAATLDSTRPTDCDPATLRFPSLSERGRYRIEVTTAADVEWTATATRVAGTAQSADARCRVLQLNSRGETSARDDADAESGRECWDR